MTYPRHAQVSLRATPYYHVVSRCVRRSWLWGFDAYAGKDFSHRKAWVLERLSTLAQVFAIDICAYAVMANHYHLVLRIGDTIEVREKRVYVNGQPMTVNIESIYRGHHHDRGNVGFVPEENLVGKAVRIWFNWDVPKGPIWSRIGTAIRQTHELLHARRQVFITRQQFPNLHKRC